MRLLSLEYIILFIIFIIYIIFMYNNTDRIFIMIFLVFIVTESVLGLSLIIFIIRNYGNININNINILKFYI